MGQIRNLWVRLQFAAENINENVNAFTKNVILRIEDSRDRFFTKTFSDNYVNTYLFLRKLTGDPHLAEDLLQETYFQCWLGLDNIMKAKSLKAYIKKIAIRRWYKHLKAKENYYSLDLFFAEIEEDERLYYFEDHFENELVELVLNQLKPLHAKALRLKFDGCIAREIAAELNIPKSKAEFFISEGRASARKFLRDKL